MGKNTYFGGYEEFFLGKFIWEGMISFKIGKIRTTLTGNSKFHDFMIHLTSL